MEFSNAVFLWGLLAVPLPILLHLFFKRRKSKVAFSTLQFFHQRKKYLAHRRRLREGGRQGPPHPPLSLSVRCRLAG